MRCYVWYECDGYGALDALRIGKVRCSNRLVTLLLGTLLGALCNDNV